MFHVKHVIIEVWDKLFPNIIYMKVRSTMTLLELIQALVEAESNEDRMRLVEDNMEIVEQVKDYDPDATNSQVEELTQQLQDMTDKHNALADKYSKAFWTKVSGGASSQSNPNDDQGGADENAEPVTIDNLNLTLE